VVANNATSAAINFDGAITGSSGLALATLGDGTITVNADVTLTGPNSALNVNSSGSAVLSKKVVVDGAVRVVANKQVQVAGVSSVNSDVNLQAGGAGVYDLTINSAATVVGKSGVSIQTTGNVLQNGNVQSNGNIGVVAGKSIVMDAAAVTTGVYLSGPNQSISYSAGDNVTAATFLGGPNYLASVQAGAGKNVTSALSPAAANFDGFSSLTLGSNVAAVNVGAKNAPITVSNIGSVAAGGVTAWGDKELHVASVSATQDLIIQRASVSAAAGTSSNLELISNKGVVNADSGVAGITSSGAGTVNMQIKAASFNNNTNAVFNNGAAAGSVLLQADKITLDSNVVYGDSININSNTPGLDISITNTILPSSTQLQLSHGSFNKLSGAGLVVIGSVDLSVGKASGNISFDGSADFTALPNQTYKFYSGGNISSSGKSVLVRNFEANALGNITLTGNNQLGELKLSSGGNITIKDVGGSLILDSVFSTGSTSIDSSGALTQKLLGSTAVTASVTNLKAASIGGAFQPVVLSSPNVSLEATAGSINVADVQNSAIDSLKATGNATYTSATPLVVQNAGINVGGTLALDALGVTIKATSVTANNVQINANAGDVFVDARLGSASINGLSSVSIAGNNVNVLGGDIAGAKAEIVSGGTGTINAIGSFILQGGTQANAYAALNVAGNVTITAPGVSVLGGSGSNAYARLDPGVGSKLVVNATNANVQGGTGIGAYGAIVSSGDITINANNLDLIAGSGNDADAVVLSYLGVVGLPANCLGCVVLTANPLGNGITQTGYWSGGVAPPVMITPPIVVAPVPTPPIVSQPPNTGDVVVFTDTFIGGITPPPRRLPGDPDVVVENCPR
jgi:filamentous hemagglutinin